MKVLRDLREATKLLILLEITKHRHTRLKSIAEKLEMTVQGISDYMKIMSGESLVQSIGGEYRATKKGVEFLHENFLKLKDFVNSSMKEMSIVDLCVAVAGKDIKEGEEVGLFMEDGYLIAYPGRSSPSKGVALFNAKKGEDVALKDLEGIVELKPGKITIMKIPSIHEGGTHSLDIAEAKRACNKVKAHKVAVTDALSKVLASKIDLKVDMEFAAVSASLEAAQKGLDILIICSKDSSSEVIAAIESINAALEDKIQYNVLTLQKK